MTYSFKVSPKTKEAMIKFYSDRKRDKTPQYAIFQANSEDTVVTLYESDKVVFQGVSADIDANMWAEFEKKNNPDFVLDKKEKVKDEKIKDEKFFNVSAIGSDEVGTGDFFGPIVVTACFVDKKDVSFLKEIGIKDSKDLSDEDILKLVPKFIDKTPYESVVLSNKEYNERYAEISNMNKIKAVLHNKVLYNMKNKIPDYDMIIVDEFAKSYIYYNYLRDIEPVVKNIKFVTKAEKKNYAVACAALISRYIFIKEFDKLSSQFGIVIPKGASALVDEVAVNLAKEHGIDILNDIAKLNFKNLDKVKEQLN